jgi:CheY-like chemotaxis protein
VLDILLRDEEAWGFLGQLKGTPDTQHLPVVVVSTVDDRPKAMSLGADAYAPKPIDRAWLLDMLTRLTGADRLKRVLLVDDQEVTRYILRQFVEAGRCSAIEAATGEEGVRKAKEEQPDVVLLDLGLPDVSGREVLQRLKSDPATTDIPVVIVTSGRLERHEREWFAASASDIVSKDTLTSEVVAGAIRHATAEPRSRSVNG